MAISLLALLSSQPAIAENLLYQDGKFYTDATEALAAIQRDLDRQFELVALSPTPLPGKLLIVLPDRDLIAHMPQNASKNLSEEVRKFFIGSNQLRYRADAKAIVKAHLVEHIDIVERNDTFEPSFDGYDFIIWYQVSPISRGAQPFRWQLRKRDSTARLSPQMGPTTAARVMSDLVAAFGRGLNQLATQSASSLPPPYEQLPFVNIGAPFGFPLPDMNSMFEAKAHVRVQSSLSTSEGHADAIDNGRSTLDILITDDQAPMDRLERRHRIDVASRRELVADPLVVVVPADARRDVTIKSGMSVDALLGDGKLALADPTKASSAAAAKAALKALGLWDAVQPRLLTMRDPPGVTLWGAGGRMAISIVSHHQATATIVFASEAPPGIQTIRIAARIPDTVYSAPHWAVAIVAGHESPATRAAIDFLLRDGRTLLLEHYGFSAP